MPTLVGPGWVDIALNHDTGAQVATNQFQKTFVVDLTRDPRHQNVVINRMTAMEGGKSGFAGAKTSQRIYSDQRQRRNAAPC